MFRGKELKDLERRRRELVLQSTLNRLMIRAELRNVKTALRPVEQIVGSVRALRPWLFVLAPLTGILAGRSLRNNGSGFSKAIGVLKWLHSLLALWKQFRPASTRAVPDTPATMMEPGPRV
jgi:hypothetical protein